jgi:hypothetical protein
LLVYENGRFQRKAGDLLERIQGGQLFREAWITGVKRYYEGIPKEGYIAPWGQMGQWEQESAIAVFEQVCQFVLVTGGKTQQLSRDQRGRFVCLCWIGQMFTHFPDPKPSYVTDWEGLPIWQKETDADIFDAIETVVLQERVQA